jgi:hypothetical protein
MSGSAVVHFVLIRYIAAAVIQKNIRESHYDFFK